MLPLFFIVLTVYIAVLLSIGSLLGLTVKSQAKLTMIARLVFCTEAMENGFASVCGKPEDRGA